MRILVAPSHVTLSTATPARMTIILHNDGDDDRVCFPTLEGIDAAAFDVIFEPSLGFIEARCAAKFEVFIEARTPATRMSRLERALWTIYADGRIADRHAVEIKLEPYRLLSARVSEGERPQLVLFNEGAIDESIHVDTMIDANATPAMAREWTIGPGSWVSVPLEFEEANSAPVTLCITGGPRPLLIEAQGVQRPLEAASQHRHRRRGFWRRGAVAAGAMAASLLLGLPLDRLSHTVGPSLAQGPILAQAMPFIALDSSLTAMRARAVDRQMAARLIALAHPVRGLQQPVRDVQQPVRGLQRPVVATHRSLALRRAPQTNFTRRKAHVTTFDTPAEVLSGARVAIHYGSKDARSVRIVAKIGPTVVRTFNLGGGSGQVSLNAPAGRSSSRLMTVRIYALGSDKAIATREAFISIVPG